MAVVERSVLLGFGADEVFHLVGNIEDYPKFVPGCTSARIEEHGQDSVRARLGFKLKGISDTFVTQNRLEHGRRIDMTLLEGPFRRLAGAWEFQPLAERACKVTLKLSLEFGSRPLEQMLAPLLDLAINGVIDAFRKRAEALYGR